MSEAYDRMQKLLAEAENRERRGIFVPPKTEPLPTPPLPEVPPVERVSPARRTEKQAALLRKFGLPDDVSKLQATRLLGQHLRQRKAGKKSPPCTPRQREILKALCIDYRGLSADEADRAIEVIARRNQDNR